MLHLKLTPRTIRRLCVTMALIAPIIYLFGSLFMGLNGAHGAFPYSAEYEVVTGSDSYNLNQHFDAQGYDGSSNYIYPVDDYSLITGHKYYVSCYFDITVSVVGEVSASTIGAFRYNNGYLYTWTASYSSPGTYFISGFYESIVNAVVDDSLFFSSFVNNAIFVERDIHNVMLIDLSFMFGIGNEPSSASAFRALFPEPYYSYTEYSLVYRDVYGVPDNSQYVFNQFFAKDNWLAQLGRDAVSVSPHGFAPFGALFRWLDLNVLNIGDTQVGLMAYGYLYWCAHVLVFDLVFMIATFFITFVDSCFTKFNRSE